MCSLYHYNPLVVVGICRKNGGAGATVRIGDDDSHNLQEYTYKKITPCDVCSQVLRGEFAFNTTATESTIPPPPLPHSPMHRSGKAGHRSQCGVHVR